MTDKPNYYTQRDWDRAVGYGTVPEKYQYPHLREKTKESQEKDTDDKET